MTFETLETWNLSFAGFMDAFADETLQAVFLKSWRKILTRDGVDWMDLVIIEKCCRHVQCLLDIVLVIRHLVRWWLQS